ncbi:MAG TPA: cytochrome c [Gaiellaceae bacterium]|nr:cytochrome c [Gaiellaceae bacterium]
MRVQVRIGLVAVAAAVAVATPVAFAHRTAVHAPPRTGNIANGFRVFNDYFCADCHVLKAAGPASYRGANVCAGDTDCIVGVDFDKVHVPYQAAIAVVASGLPAALPLYPTQMPPFRNVLTKTQIRDVAAFLAKYSGGYKTCTECKGITPTGFPAG